MSKILLAILIKENAKLTKQIDELRGEASWIQDQTGYQRIGL